MWLALTLSALALPATPPPARVLWANFLLGLLLDLALVGALKGAVRRSRPVYNRREDFTVVVAVDRFSFPSGHSSRCAAGLKPERTFAHAARCWRCWARR